MVERAAKTGGGTALRSRNTRWWIVAAASVATVAVILVGRHVRTDSPRGRGHAHAATAGETAASETPQDEPNHEPTGAAGEPAPEIENVPADRAGAIANEASQVGRRENVAEPAAKDEAAKLQARLRSDDAFDVMDVERELDKRGLSIDYDRLRPISPPERPADATSALAFEAEIVGEDIVARWNVWFGPELFDGSPVRHYYTISVRGGTLPREQEHRVTPVAGENAGEVVLARGVGAGRYSLGIFMWSRRPSDGMQLSDNASALFLNKR